MTTTTDDLFNELWDVSYSCEKVECGIGGVKQEDELRNRWDALLSRASQEAVEEYKKSQSAFPLLSGKMVSEIYQNALNQPLREKDEKTVTAIVSEAWHRSVLRHGNNEKLADDADKRVFEARREGRLEGLKEMDEAIGIWLDGGDKSVILKLLSEMNAEYNQP